LACFYCAPQITEIGNTENGNPKTAKSAAVLVSLIVVGAPDLSFLRIVGDIMDSFGLRRPIEHFPFYLTVVMTTDMIFAAFYVQFVSLHFMVLQVSHPFNIHRYFHLSLILCLLGSQQYIASLMPLSEPLSRQLLSTTFICTAVRQLSILLAANMGK
jgi:hypothetical protein